MTRQTDAPTASVFDANSYALQHAARTMPDGSRSIRLLKIITGTSVTHGARSTCWSPPKARSHSGNQPATRVSYPPAAGRSNDKNPSAWSNASSHGDTTFIAGSWPGYSAQCSRPEEVSGLLADVGLTTSWIGEELRIGAPRQAMTDRAGRWVTEQVGHYARSVNEVAIEIGCGWHTINDTVIAYGTALVDDPNRFGTVDVNPDN